MSAHRSEIAATVLPGVYVSSMLSARSFPRHWHDTYGVGLIVQGGQQSFSGRGAVEAFAGQCISHNPGEVHDGRPIGNAARCWRMFHIEPAAMQRLFGQTMTHAHEWHDPVFKDATLYLQLKNAFDVAASLQPTEPSRIAAPQGLLEEALLMAIGCTSALHRASRNAHRAADDLSKVMERLADDIALAPTLDELSAQSGLGRYTLVRQFKRRYGLPPIAWLMQLRLQRARTRIAAGHSLTDVALACGFSDQSHLTRLFTRQFGFTPGTWRKATRGHDQ
jgi:AraC-like DNA-binding protein